MKTFPKLINLLSLPYRPFSNIWWSEKTNKLIRFSKEVMLLCEAKKPNKKW
jgi:hypothetical protein